jgi:hypothetical protein
MILFNINDVGINNSLQPADAVDHKRQGCFLFLELLHSLTHN